MSLFNVRVYGVLLSEGKLLVSDEYIKGSFYTKLPGGGLEKGEGTIECLIREFKEETGLDIEVGAHLYTTDFYQPSAFRQDDQVISVYYWVHCNDLSGLVTHEKPFDFGGDPGTLETGQVGESFRWVPYLEITEQTMSLPIDRKVMSLLLAARPVPPESKNRPDTSAGVFFLQDAPFVVPTTDGKLIEEHFGGASTGRKDVSVAHMVAPAGWSEPVQWPEFDEWTLVEKGQKCLIINGQQVLLKAGQSIWVSKGASVQYSNPFDEPCAYWSVCLPAFSPERVHRESEGG